MMIEYLSRMFDPASDTGTDPRRLVRYGMCTECGRPIMLRSGKPRVCAVCEMADREIIEHPRIEAVLEWWGTPAGVVTFGAVVGVVFYIVLRLVV